MMEEELQVWLKKIGVYLHAFYVESVTLSPYYKVTVV